MENSQNKCYYSIHHHSIIGRYIFPDVCNTKVMEEQALKTKNMYGQVLCEKHEILVKEKISAFSGYVKYYKNFITIYGINNGANIT